MSILLLQRDAAGRVTLIRVQKLPIDTFGDWLNEAKLSVSEFARQAGYDNPQTIYNWRRRKILPPTEYERVAKFFGRTIDQLLTGDSGIAPPAPKVYRVPVVGTAQLGVDGFWTELGHPEGHGDGHIDWPSRDPNAYAVRVVGDSMHPRVKSGEFVVVEPNHPYAPGDEVLVITKDGRSMVKEFLFARDGKVSLHSVNDNHARVTLDQSEIDRIHYVAAIARPSLRWQD